MGLLSLFQRAQRDPRDATAPDAADVSASESDLVAAARTRARRRLIGAAVLLGIGVVGFPLLFETQPRPVPVNIPIEIPRKDGAPPLTPPAPSPALSAASAAVVLPDAEVAPDADTKAADARSASKRPPELTERAADAGRELPVPGQGAAAPVAPAVAAAPAVRPSAPASRPAVVASAPRSAAAADKVDAAQAAAQAAAQKDAARAQALLNGQSAGPAVPPSASQAASAAPSTRVIVQVGAYTDPAKLKEARDKVEKLGFKTYTQVVEVDGAKRTRVRIGPFATKAEADKAAARIKAGGLPAAILSL